jgi:hypothetical protein
MEDYSEKHKQLEMRGSSHVEDHLVNVFFSIWGITPASVSK